MRSFGKYFRKAFGIKRKRLTPKRKNIYVYAKPWRSNIYVYRSAIGHSKYF